MAVELATAYVSLVVDTAKIPDQVKGGFKTAPAISRTAGQGMGTEMSKGVGETFRTGVESAIGEVPLAGIVTGALSKGLFGGAVGVAAAAGGVIATSLTKGFERLTAIDSAQGKLSGLGHTAQETASIMQSALTAVKGTAFGLGDAASIAASAVAAGVKPGQDLTRYLGLVADSAAIAGTNLGDMGYIINEVQTGQRAYTRELNEFSTRGVPIFQWLQNEYHVSALELRKMVEGGKVDSAHFLQAIQDNIGGAAKTMGSKTFKGAIDNLNAALGRVGAAAIQPFFDRMKIGATDGTSALDKLTPKVTELSKELDNKIFNDWGPKLKTGFDELKKNPEVQESVKDLASGFHQVQQSVKDITPALSTTISTLAKAGGGAGFSLLHIGVDTLASSLRVASPILQSFGTFLEENQGFAKTLLATWLAFKSVNVVQGYLNNLAGSVKDFSAKADVAGGKAAYLGGAVGKFLGKTALAGAVAGLSALSQQTDSYGQKTEGAKEASYGLNVVLGTMAGSTLGPWGAAAGAAAGAGLSLWQMLHQNADESKRLDDNMKSQIQTMDQLTGKQTQQTVDATASKLGGRINQAAGLGLNRNRFVAAASGLDQDFLNQANTGLGRNISGSSTVQYWAKLNGMSTDDFTKALEGQSQYVSKVKDGQAELNTVRDQLKNDPFVQSSIDTARALNQEADANVKASISAQQFIKDTNGQFQATDSLKQKIGELGGAIAATPKKNVVEITAPPGADPATFKQKIDDLHLGVVELEADNKTIKVVLDDSQAQSDIKKLEQQEIAPKKVSITAEIIQQYAPAQLGPGLDNPSVPLPPLLHRADGGPGPVFGAGGPTSDSVPAMLSVKEHVWSAAETDAVGGHAGMYKLRAMALAGGLKFAQGGTPLGITDAIKAAQDMEGHKYLWGGSGPENFDCSGFIGFLQQVAMGLGRTTKRLYTTNTVLDGSSMAGLKPGLGPAGTWFQVGVSPEHMAGTIAGLHVESGGSKGTSGIGAGRAGALDAQFPGKFYLPNELIAGFNGLVSGGKLVTWTAQDERDLQRLKIAVDEAKQKRDKTYANPKATATDKRKADFDVEDAQGKVVDKQAEKDKQGTIEGGTRIAPQAPAVQKRYNEDEIQRATDEQALEQANQKRNQVYDDPASTEADKQVADAEWQKAYDEVQIPGSKDIPKPKSVRDVLTSFASGVVGVAFDAFKAQLPSELGGSHWWSAADQAVSLAVDYSGHKKSKITQDALSGIPTFGAQQFLGQLGYSKQSNVPDWAKNLAAPRVFDTGGWLAPGEMGINLSSKPEPIFNSPAQLQAFAGSQLQPAQQSGGLTEQDVMKIMSTRPEYHLHVSSVDEAMQKVRVEQQRQRLTYKRR